MSLASDCGQVLLEVPFDLTLTADCVVVKHDPVATNIEWQFCASLSQQDRGLSQRMSITQFVKDVLIDRSYFCNHNVGLFYFALYVLENYSRSRFFIYPTNLKTCFLGLALNDLAVKRVIWFCKMHNHKCSRAAAVDCEIGEGNCLIACCYQAKLPTVEWLR